MAVEINELKSMLEDFRVNVEKAIVDKTKDLSDKSDKSAEEIKNLQKKLDEAEKALQAIKEQQEKPFGLPGVEHEKEKFSWSKYFTGLYKNHIAMKGDITSSEAKTFWDKDASFELRVCKDYAADDGSSGGFIVPPQIYQGDIIDTVYANTAVMKMPIMKLPNLKSDIPIPVDDGNLSSYHVGEVEAPTKTSASFSLSWLRPKKIGTFVPVSNRLLYQTNNAIEMIVKGKMALDAAVEMSRGLAVGSGSDSEPRGIFSYYDLFTGAKNLSTNGRKLTIDDLASMKMALAVANELRDTNTYGAIMHPAALWGMLRERVEMYSGQAERKGQHKADKLLLDKSIIATALKAAIEDTTQVPTGTVGSSTTCSKVVFGDWSKFVVGTFRDPVFKISDQASDASGNSAFLKDQTYIVMFLEYDSVLTRATSFTGRDGAETNEDNW